MKLIGRELLTKFKEKYSDSRAQLNSWESEVEAAQWDTPHDLKKRYSTADPIGGQRVVFNICGNKYRLLAIVNYLNKMVLVKKIGTHNEYDKWKLK